jgi:hypothetical protein
MPVRTRVRLAGKRQELEAWLADAHRDRERFEGHLGDVFPSKGVGIFTVVVVITAENERWAELFEEESGRLRAELRLVAVPTDSGDGTSLAKWATARVREPVQRDVGQ